MKKITLLLSLFTCYSALSAQSLYDETVVQEIEIFFSQNNWDQLLDAEKASTEDYIMADSVAINGEVFDSVGVKYKGNSTYNANQTKNPWHIELDTYKEQDYDGYKDIKLSNVANDPSFVREVLSYKVLRNYMDAPLSNYANVRVNGTLIGLYVSSEAVSKTFLSDRFDSKSNTFVKCNPIDGAGPGSSELPDLVYYGNDSTVYYDEAYELKSDYGWSELIDLCDTLDNNLADIEAILDVDRAIWMLAFDNALVNLDSYIGAFQQNYYLYKDDYGRFLPVVWDLNESFGKFAMSGSGNLNSTAQKQQMSHLLHVNDADFPLISQILSVPTYKRMYLAHYKTILEDNFTNNGLYYTQGQAFQATASASVQADPNKFYSYNNFTANLTSDINAGGPGPGGGSVNGITSLMNGRSSYLLNLTDFTNVQPVISNLTVSNTTPFIGDNVIFNVNVVNENTVYFRYRETDHAPFEKVQMFDDGLHNDGAANDDVYGAAISINSPLIQYYYYAENSNIGKFSPTNAEHEFYTLEASYQTTGSVVINELMASNDTTMADQDGEFDDWIEIYNNGTTPVDISGFTLTDDATDFTLFAFPAGTSIAADEYIIVWADKDVAQSGYHADFKLSSGGETVILTDDFFNILDVVDFGEQATDSTYGRYPNGTGPFQGLLSTFASENNLTGTVVNPTSPSYDVVINEFMVQNDNTMADQNGEFDAWIEIYNNESFAVDLTGYSLSDDSTNFTLFSFPLGTSIAADDYIIVWADQDLAQTGYHANFFLSSAGGSLFLADSALEVIDIVEYQAQAIDSTFGRFPNGTGPFQGMEATFAEENNLNGAVIDTSLIIYDVVINEFMALNDTTMADQDGEFDSWVEIYNNESFTVDLSDFSISDDSTNFTLFSFPVGTSIGAGDYIVVWADEDIAQAGYHANFSLSPSGGSLFLADPAMTVMDLVIYPSQIVDRTYGRYPNGTGPFQELQATFAAENMTIDTTTAIRDLNNGVGSISIYPNPAHDLVAVSIENSLNEEIMVRIFDLRGQLKYIGEIVDNLNVSTATWSEGVYFVLVGNSSEKLLIGHK